MRPKSLPFTFAKAAIAQSFARAETTEPFPSAPPPARNEILVTGGAGLPVPSIGVKLRHNQSFESGIRLGWFPAAWTAELGANFFADNPEPGKRATWYGGLEFVHYRSNGTGGKFRLDFLDGICGQERPIAGGLRWAWEAGLGALVSYEFHGGGAPILFPVIPVGRAELRYSLL